MDNKHALKRILATLFFAFVGITLWGAALIPDHPASISIVEFAVGVVMFAIAAGIGKPVWNRR